MRLLLCGAAALALSGCSWLGYTTDGYSNGHSGYNAGASHTSGGHYNPQVSTGHYNGPAYSAGGYQYPIAKTYPVEFDPNGALVGNRMYEAVPHQGTAYHAGGHYVQGQPASGHHQARKGTLINPYGIKPENRWTVTGGVGADFSTGGDLFRGQDAALAGFNNITADEAYDPGVRAELGVARSLKGNRMITGQAFYTQANGTQVALRETPQDITVGNFSDYESYGAELGLRQYVSMPPTTQYKPYVEGRLGASYIDDIGLEDFRLSTAPAADGRDFTLYEGGWVPSAAALIGVERPVSSNMMLGLETGIRYEGGLDSAAIEPANTALEGSNQFDERWSVPVNIRGRYRF